MNPVAEPDPVAASDDSATVFVVDDDPQVRESLSLLLESVDLKVETFASAEQFLQTHGSLRSGCLVLDVRMPGMSGLQLQRELTARGCSLPTLILTAHGEIPMAVEAMKAGAVDFIEKPYSPQVLLERIQQVLNEDSRSRREHRVLISIQHRIDTLSPREREVMRFVVTGHSTKWIAETLDVSDKTVDFHRRNLLRKMQVDTVVELGRLIEFYERAM